MDIKKTSSPNVIRKPHLAEKVVFVDGLPGCGKTMLSPIVAAFDRVEKLTYAYEIENICSLKVLNRIEEDAVIAMVRTWTDLSLYNLMMSRDTNFRPSDLSSIFRDIKPWQYIKRLFKKGDEMIPQRVKEEKPILHLTTHRILGISEPIFCALGSRVSFIEVVRHPLYMIKQQVLNVERLFSDVRHFTAYFIYKGHELPYYTFGWEDLFINSNDVEKVIYGIDKLSRDTEKVKEYLMKKYNANILTIPFEMFVINPWSYMEKIKKLLGTKITKATHKMMKRQRVPRKMYAEGIGLKSYKRYGWKPPRTSLDEEKEFVVRREFAQKQASPEVMQVLDRLCAEYEEKYMGGRRRKI